MELDSMKVVNNIGFIDLNKLSSLSFDVEKEYNIRALVIRLNEEQISDTDVEKLYDYILKMPWITIALFDEEIKEKALIVGSAMHIRIALLHTKYSITWEDILKNQRISNLIGCESRRKNSNLKGNVDNSKELLQLGLISNVIQDLEGEEFQNWLHLLFGNKDKEQLIAIKSCYDKYRTVLSKTSDRGILALEESKQFCLLAANLYRKSR